MDGDGRGLGVERQREDVIRLAEVLRLPLDPTNVIVENDPTPNGKPSKASASVYANKPRAKYDALLARVRAGEVSHVLAYSTSRLTRDMREREDLLDLRHAGATIITSQGQRIYPGMSSSEVDMIRMLGVGDTGYSDKISELVQRTTKGNAKAGTPHGPKAYGWHRGRAADGTPVDTIDDEQAAVIREVARRMIDGEPTRSIVRDLNAREIPAPRGGQWAVSTLSTLMRRERNAGRRVHQGEVFGEAAWDALYDADTHAAVVARLTDPTRSTTRRGGRRHLLVGLLVCGVCGSNGSRVVVANGSKPESYGCRECFRYSRKRESLDEYVTEVVCARMATPGALDDLTVDPGALDAARARVATLRGSLAERVDMLDAGEIDRASYARSAERLRAQIVQAEAQIEAARPLPSAVRALHGFDTIEATREVWDGMTLDQQRAAIEALVRVTVLPSRSSRFDADSIRLDWIGAA